LREKLESAFLTNSMTLDDIKNINEFQTYLYRQSNIEPVQKVILDLSKTICNTNNASELLYILPSTQQLENIQFYDRLKFITINNYKIDKKNFEILKKYKDKLENVSHLHIWNIKQNDLDFVELFPNLTHLLVSYIRKADFSFNGLDKTKKLNTLCLISINKIPDFNFLTTSQKPKLKNLSLEYTSNLKSFEGLDEFINLENLSLFASTSESRKTVTLENINGIESLSKLKSFEIEYFKFDKTELQAKLKNLKNLIRYKLDRKDYDNL